MFSLQALTWLTTQTRLHDRLDWWALEDWRDSDALIALGKPRTEKLSAAVLAVPIEIAAIKSLHTASSAAAWLRWCVVADGQSPSALLRTLLAETEVRLRCTCVRQLWCVCEAHDWLATNLRDLGFTRRDELMTLNRLSRKPVNWVLPKHITLRVLHPALIDSHQMAQIHELDAAAFQPHWRYSAYVLRRAFLQSCYVTVAEQEGRLVGYQCALHDGGNPGDSVAHITRLVVHPSAQRGGVGRALFGDAVGELLRRGVSEITLNTPASNATAQRLYKRFGFAPLAQRMAVLCKDLDAPAQD